MTLSLLPKTSICSFIFLFYGFIFSRISPTVCFETADFAFATKMKFMKKKPRSNDSFRLVSFLSNKLPYSPSSPSRSTTTLWDSPSYDSESNPNSWIPSSSSSDDSEKDSNAADWEEELRTPQDKSWSSFTSSNNEDEESTDSSTSISDGSESWLDSIADIAASEVNFITEDADRANKVRQMAEWGFSSEIIADTLGVEMDENMEIEKNDNDVLEKFKEETFGLYIDDDVDLESVESHQMVPHDDEGFPIRTQMVYVDEHTCIGMSHYSYSCYVSSRDYIYLSSISI